MLKLSCQVIGKPLVAFVDEVSIDSRTLREGSLFVALAGERFDGHDFIRQAAEKGAKAVLCERPQENIPCVQYVVPNALTALTALACYHRQVMACPIIALTGSNGKTSVKEMISHCLPQPALATKGNLNNHIGAPLSVLQLTKAHRYAVFELGANHLGEIKHTVAVVKPDVALINNIGPAHIAEFGSLENIARAKGEIYEGLSAEGIAVINADDDFAHFWDPLLHAKKVLRFSLEKPMDVYARDICFNSEGCASFVMVLPDDRLPITLKVPGEHSIRNALAAATCCYAVGISSANIAAGLAAFEGVRGRMAYCQGKNQSTIIDDTYNANLRSVLTALTILAKRQGYRILVLGDMGELGQWAQAHHEEIGQAAQAQGIDLLLTCGEHSLFTSQAFGQAGKHYSSHDALAKELLSKLDKNTTVLVKGSRFAQMEKIVHQLIE